MLRTNRNERLVVSQGIEAKLQSIFLPPGKFLLDVVEHRNDVPKAILYIDIAICDRDQQHFEFLRSSRKCKEHGQDIVDTLR